jgi:hypothetical protein
LNRSEAAWQDRVDSIRLAERPVGPPLKSRRTECVVERDVTLLNGWDVRANFLRLAEGPSLGEESTDARLFKSLESFALKPPPFRFLAPFLFGDLGFPLDHPVTMVLGAGTAHGTHARPWTTMATAMSPSRLSSGCPSTSVHVSIGWSPPHSAISWQRIGPLTPFGCVDAVFTPVFGITVLLMAFPFTWLYVDSRASVIAVALIHCVLNATGDTFTSSKYVAGNPLIVRAGGLIAAAVLWMIVLVGGGRRYGKRAQRPLVVPCKSSRTRRQSFKSRNSEGD